MAERDDFMGRFNACLALIAKAAFELNRVHGVDVVLVGGAAVALYTDGAFQSGDFDLVTAAGADFVRILLMNGFLENDGPGRLKNRYFHPSRPEFGVQLVSGQLFDGRTDLIRLLRVDIDEAGAGIKLPPIEDLIADRLAQYAANPVDQSRLAQARVLFALAKNIDHHYLVKRVLEEGGDIALLDDGGSRALYQPR